MGKLEEEVTSYIMWLVATFLLWRTTVWCRSCHACFEQALKYDSETRTHNTKEQE